MIYQLFRAKITKISDKTCIIYTILQNLTIKVLVFPEIYTNFAPKKSNFKLRNIIKNLMKMKKYLTMVLAIAISGVFVSCHEDEVSGSLIEQKKIAFEDAFVKAFGQPDPNHNWGFRIPEGDEALTRGENANANEWADPNKAYGGLKVPPPLTSEQIAVVKEYFQTVPNIKYEDPHWTNYFIQQVYKGNPETAGDYSPEQYLAGNNSTWIIGSNNMDHLAAIDGSFVDHINNFNHGDCSSNSTVCDNGGNANSGPFHTDKIMYMQNSTTKSFGYYNSNGSVRRTEYTGLVGYQTIIDALGPKANCLKDGWNRSFMGFDFEQMVDKEMFTDATFQFDGKTYNFLSANTNMYCVDRKEKSYSTIGGVANFNDRPSDAIISDLLSKGYLPTSDTLKDWVKVGGTADGYYSDWIVTLTKAESTVPIPEVKQVSQNPGGYYVTVQDVIESGRVMCEDLAGAKFNSKTLDDLDYNDIVYDAVIVDEYKMPSDAEGNPIGNKEENGYDHRYFATVRLMAAGGTIPVEIVIPDENGDQNFDVHEELGAGDNVMINTLAKEERLSVNGALVKDDAKPKTLINQKDGTTKFYGVKYIKKIGLNVFYNHVSIDLTEKYKAATLMFLVPLETQWAKERVNFKTGYPYFPDWVQKPQNVTWYEKNTPQYLYEPDPELVGLNENDFKTKSNPVYISGSETYSKTKVSATSTMIYPSGSEKKIYNYAQHEEPGYLCPEVGEEAEENLTITLSDNDKASIAVDQTIRIYGVNIPGWYVKTNISGNEEFNTGSYIDIPVTNSNIDLIKSGITIGGKHFTVTYVTIVGGNSNTDNQGTDEGGNGNTENQGTDEGGNGNTDNQGTDEGGNGNTDNQGTDEGGNGSGEIKDIFTSGKSFYDNANETIVSSSEFSGTKKGDIMRIYVEILGDGWYLDIKTEWNNYITFANNSSGARINSQNNLIINNCITLEFDDNTSNMLTNQRGLHPYGHNIKITKITLEKK